MMNRAAALVAVTALGSVAYVPEAAACFDGFSVTSEQVTATVMTDGEWRMSEVRTMARWTKRLDALLPDGADVTMHNSYAADVCTGGGHCESITLVGFDEDAPSLEQQMLRLFNRSAAALGTSPRQVARARTRPVAVYSVQIGSFRSYARAYGVAEKLNMDAQMGSPRWEHQSFYSAGGYPAIHDPVAVHTVNVGGKSLHRVIAGVFVDPDKATAYRKRLSKAGFASSMSVEIL